MLSFPAWDCLPYDRVSPNADIVSRRIDVLTRLAAGSEKQPFVLLTTVNAVVQRVPPRRLFDGRVLKLGAGGRIPLDRLQGFFRNNGYIRTDTVREPGEYAVRGGIVDLWPSGAATPIRLDFFGDTLESLRGFDPLTQRSTGALDSFMLRPVSEVLLDDAAIQRFRSRYREAFGAVGTDDPLYESVSAGRRQAGMEHWLPFYYETLETLFDYLPGAAVSLDHQAEEARAHRLELDRRFLRRPRDDQRRRNATGAAPRRCTARSSPTGCSSARRIGQRRCRPRHVQLRRCDAREDLYPHPNPPPLRGRELGRPFAPPPPQAGDGGSRDADASTPAPVPRKISPPSAPTPASTCSTPCATISPPSRKPAAAPRSPPIAKARPTGSPPCCASTASPNCAASPTPPRSRNSPGSAPSASPSCRSNKATPPDDLLFLGEQDILGDRLARSAAPPPQCR